MAKSSAWTRFRIAELHQHAGSVQALNRLSAIAVALAIEALLEDASFLTSRKLCRVFLQFIIGERIVMRRSSFVLAKEQSVGSASGCVSAVLAVTSRQETTTHPLGWRRMTRKILGRLSFGSNEPLRGAGSDGPTSLQLFTALRFRFRNQRIVARRVGPN